MEAFFISTVSIAVAEFGDKTQLLTLLFATRFNKPITIILGIFTAILINHIAAAFLGQWFSDFLSVRVLHGLLALSFFMAAFWLLSPKEQNTAQKAPYYQVNVFITTFVSFFLAEMGDKTQIATLLMAAQFKTTWPVILGTTSGVLLVNAPVVFLGKQINQLIPLKTVRFISSSIFLLLGIWELFKLLGKISG